MNFFRPKNHANLFSMLCCLTLLCVIAQIALFAIHYKIGELVDSLVTHSLSEKLFSSVVILPIISFVLLQLTSYFLLIGWIWFIATSCGELFKWSSFPTYLMGLFFWTVSLIAIFSLNNYYFPDSFFSHLLREQVGISDRINLLFVFVTSTLLVIATLLAYVYVLWHKQHILMGGLFLLLVFGIAALSLGEKSSLNMIAQKKNSPPNIIFIGLDSLRPDFTGYFDNQQIHTPNIDQFLKSAATFTNAYTPLARTFPAWVSILTAKYPIHSQARNNLTDPERILKNDLLAKRLKNAGYETIYATDEKRFSNITTDYGFDHVLGPNMGVNDFILGGLSDFPLTNLLVNLSSGKFLFPFNFANRAAAITYEPENFLQLIKSRLANRSDKPLFLAVHLCTSHWPYTWAHDQQPDDSTQAERYHSSVEAVDKQLGQLMHLLKKNGLLENSIVVLLSDHGTTVGLPGDRIITEKNYRGANDHLNWIPRYNEASPQKKLVLNTSYGQGTDILSLKQYHILLAIQGFGIKIPPHQIHERSSLLDIAPTILDALKLQPMKSIDGKSFANDLTHTISQKNNSRPFYLETGYSISAIETDDISVNHVINQSIGAYQINKQGLVYVNPAVEQSIINDKQRAVLAGDWLLAQYPASLRAKMILTRNKQLVLKNYKLPGFFVLANIKTGEWTVDRTPPTIENAPTKKLFALLYAFYGDEITQKKSASKKAG